MVVQEEGPTDGTVIVANSDQTDISDESTDIIVDLFGGIGEIILVRWGVDQFCAEEVINM